MTAAAEITHATVSATNRFEHEIGNPRKFATKQASWKDNNICNIEYVITGWGGRIRTSAWRNQKPFLFGEKQHLSHLNSGNPAISGQTLTRFLATLARKRRKVLSETYRNFTIAAFGRSAASMSAISAHSCSVGCQAIRFVPGHLRFAPGRGIIPPLCRGLCQRSKSGQDHCGLSAGKWMAEVSAEVTALEKAGVEFIAEDNGGPGVRLKRKGKRK